MSSCRLHGDLAGGQAATARRAMRVRGSAQGRELSLTRLVFLTSPLSTRRTHNPYRAKPESVRGPAFRCAYCRLRGYAMDHQFRSPDLPQRFADRHRGSHGHVETAQILTHGNGHAQIRGGMHLLRHSC